jgi:hypothetical protein
VYTDYQIVVGRRLQLRSWKMAIDGYHLPLQHLTH